MSCFNPMCCLRGVDENTGEVKWKFLGKYDPYNSKEENEKVYKKGEILPAFYKVPCGYCLGCKLDYSRHWADRMIMELESYKGKAIFLTLTYNDDTIPLQLHEVKDKWFYKMTNQEIPEEYFYHTLRKKDLQDFFKRLRDHYHNRTIRYFASGEYGSQTLRPHYHAIIYGLSLEDFKNDIRPCQKNELGQVSFTSKELEKIWNKGFILFSEVSYDTMAYVSRYSAKKIFGDNTKPDECCEDTFVVMSRRPGLGHDFIIAHKDFFEMRRYTVPDSVKPRTIYFPRYGTKILDKKDTPVYYERVRQGMDSLIDKDLLKLWKTDLPFDQLMAIEAAEKQIIVNSLLNHRKEI